MFNLSLLFVHNFSILKCRHNEISVIGTEQNDALRLTKYQGTASATADCSVGGATLFGSLESAMFFEPPLREGGWSV